MPPLRLLPDLEAALTKLPGVRAVSVVTNAEAAPLEVHVVALPGKPAKQLVRDVQSLALAELGISVDHRTVSVVQLDDEVPDAPPVASLVAREPGPEGAIAVEPAGERPRQPMEPVLTQRPVLDSVVVRTRASGFDVAVTVVRGATVFEGAADGPVHGSLRFWLVARAALDAVSGLLDVPARIEHASVIAAGDVRAAMVVLVLGVPEDGEHTLVGSALVRVDEPDAVARAVLDALNRRFGRMQPA